MGHLLPYPLRRHYFLATAFGVRRSLYYIQRDDNTIVGLNGGVVPIARGSPSPAECLDRNRRNISLAQAEKRTGNIVAGTCY